MSALAEALIAAFDSSAELTWLTGSPDQVIARFEISLTRVDTIFTETAKNQWRVAFEVSTKASASESVHESIRIFSGVFQAVREFLEVRQPAKVDFASKEEALGRLYEEYLERQENPLRKLGYRMAAQVKSSPLTEFVIEKTDPSEWRDYQS
jgi:hypothetical protein